MTSATFQTASENVTVCELSYHSTSLLSVYFHLGNTFTFSLVCLCGFRVVLKKEIRRQRVLRDGKEETVITEDIHVVQEDETSPELDAAMHEVVDQFTGRSHSGQSSV